MDGKQSDRETCFYSTWPDRDRPWSREAPQVIVAVPHFFSLQLVTQLERCDWVNVAGEAGEQTWEDRDGGCGKRKARGKES